jgi:hypothetical protein
MNINISQISNGWIITIAHPEKGQSALYIPTFPEVLKELETLTAPPDNATPLVQDAIRDNFPKKN